MDEWVAGTVSCGVSCASHAASAASADGKPCVVRPAAWKHHPPDALSKKTPTKTSAGGMGGAMA